MKALLFQLKHSSLVSGAGIYLGTSVVNASIPFLMLPILTRYLEPSEYGQVAVFSVWVSLIGAICGLSVHGSAGRKYYDFDNPDEEIGEFIASCLLLLFGSTSLVLLVIIPLAPFVSNVLGLSQEWVFIGVCVAFCNFLINLRMGQWQVRKEPLKYGVFQIFRSFLDVGLSLILVVLLTLGVTGRLGGMTTAVVIFAVLALSSLCRDGLLKITWRLDYIKEAASFGIPLIPHIVGAFLLLTVDRAVISAVIGLDEAGYYMVAAQIAGILGIVLDSVNKAFVPWLYERLKRDLDHEKRLIVKLTYGYYCILLGIATLGFLAAGPFLVLVAGPSYAPAAQIVAWLILGQSLRGMYFMVSSYILYSKRTKYLAITTISAGVINLFLMLVLLRIYGTVGAAYALCISMLFQFLVTTYFARKLVQMPWGISA